MNTGKGNGNRKRKTEKGKGHRKRTLEQGKGTGKRNKGKGHGRKMNMKHAKRGPGKGKRWKVEMTNEKIVKKEQGEDNYKTKGKGNMARTRKREKGNRKKGKEPGTISMKKET